MKSIEPYKTTKIEKFIDKFTWGIVWFLNGILIIGLVAKLIYILNTNS